MLFSFFSEEWFLDDTKCLLDEVNTESVLSIVDIYQYLLKGAEERTYTEETFPDDPNIIKALLKQVSVHVLNTITVIIMICCYVPLCKTHHMLYNQYDNNDIHSLMTIISLLFVV